jgi:hypothetical protein
MVGDAEGNVQGFRYRPGKDGENEWERISDCFSAVKVDRFATPAFIRDSEILYALVGQQDGRVRIFIADARIPGLPLFQESGYIEGIQANTHSSPTATSRDGIIELSVGDYDGNLKHFACKQMSEKTGLDK